MNLAKVQRLKKTALNNMVFPGDAKKKAFNSPFYG